MCRPRVVRPVQITVVELMHPKKHVSNNKNSTDEKEAKVNKLTDLFRQRSNVYAIRRMQGGTTKEAELLGQEHQFWVTVSDLSWELGDSSTYSNNGVLA